MGTSCLSIIDFSHSLSHSDNIHVPYINYTMLFVTISGIHKTDTFSSFISNEGHGNKTQEINKQYHQRR